jgi:hypothetical protein
LGSSLSITTVARHSTSNQKYRTLLNTKLAKVPWKKSIWSDFIGVIDVDDNPKVPKHASQRMAKPTGKIIEMMKDFTNGGFDMDIPVRYPLIGEGVYGAEQLLGAEEERRIAYKRTSLNQLRHGVKIQDNKMSKQALREPGMQKQLMRGGYEDLSDWYSRWLGYAPYDGFLYGSARHQWNTNKAGTLSLTRRSHPNFYVAGHGRVTWSQTQATYEAAIVSALGGLSDTASDHFSTRTIKNMVLAANRDHRIMPIKYDGVDLYLMIIHSNQADQLSEDTAWKDRHIYAGERNFKTNPVFTGKIAGIYQQCLILIDDYAPAVHVTGDSGFTAVYSTTATTAGPQYGVTNPMETISDSGSKKLAFLVGQSAIVAAYGSPLNFETEDWDYGQKRTEGADMFFGLERADIYDQDGELALNTGNKIVENCSSLVMATYSPDTFTWT